MLFALYIGPLILLVAGLRRSIRRVWLAGATGFVFAAIAAVINANTEDFGPGLEAAFALAALVEVGAGIRDWSDHWQAG